MSYEVAPLITAAPLLPTLSPRRPSVISCPAGACNEQFITINLSPVDDVSLEPDHDVIDQVTLGNNFPTAYQTVPSTEVVPVDQQDEEAVPVPPKPDTDQQDHPQHDLHRLDYRFLHECGREKRMLGLSPDRRETGRRTQRRTPRRRWRTQRTGVRQTHKFIVFQIVYRCLKMTG